MSPVGHSIVGLTFATITVPSARPRRWKLIAFATFIALASLPDWPLPGWGHDRYDISHSIFVNVGLIAAALAIWSSTPRLKTAIPANCFALGICAWLSHLLLDSFYNHGRGVAIYWPVSEGRLNFAMPWFNTLDLSQPIPAAHNLSVFAIEAAAYTPILTTTLVAVSLRTRAEHARLKHRERSELTTKKLSRLPRHRFGSSLRFGRESLEFVIGD